MKKKITFFFTTQVLHDFHLIFVSLVVTQVMFIHKFVPYQYWAGSANRSCSQPLLFFSCCTVRFDIYYESRHTKEYVTFGSRFVFYMMEGVCS